MLRTPHKEKLYICKDKDILFQGYRNNTDGLWDITIPQKMQVKLNATQKMRMKLNALLFKNDRFLNSSNHHPNLTKTPIKSVINKINKKLNLIMHKNTTKTELATYLHACCFSPTARTFIRAIKNENFISWPGLTPSLTSKMPLSPNTAKGHLTQERSNLQSTKPDNTIDDYNPKSKRNNVRTKFFMAKIQQFTPLDKSYSDLTGRFLVQFSRGNNYVMVIYAYDANAISAEPLKDRFAGEIVKMWRVINEKLEKAGVCPLIYILDNEISNEFKQALHKKEIKYQLVPPHIHKANAAERVIQTFKDHFLAGLASCNQKFPLREWDRLLPQAVITLNLLRNTRMNLELSTYAYLFRTYDFNQYPLSPP